MYGTTTLTNNTYTSNPVVREMRSIFVELIPSIPKATFNSVESNAIDVIRSIPWPNGIQNCNVSSMYRDVERMQKLLGAFQRTSSIEELRTIIFDINQCMAIKHPLYSIPPPYIPDVGATNIRNWVRLLKGLHPRIDLELNFTKETQMFFFRDVSEEIGSITVTTNADTSTIDQSAWGNGTELMHNVRGRNTLPFYAPSYIRETLRQKLDSNVAKIIQSSNTSLATHMQRNLPTETWKSTTPITGGECWQVRPVQPMLTQGAHNNPDWYHWQYRTLTLNPLMGLKEQGLKDSLDYLNKYYNLGDFTVHALVNHLTPLKPFAEAEKRTIEQSTPQGIEETFPTANVTQRSLTYLNGQLVNSVERDVKSDDTILKPTIG